MGDSKAIDVHTTRTDIRPACRQATSVHVLIFQCTNELKQTCVWGAETKPEYFQISRAGTQGQKEISADVNAEVG